MTWSLIASELAPVSPSPRSGVAWPTLEGGWRGPFRQIRRPHHLLAPDQAVAAVKKRGDALPYAQPVELLGRSARGISCVPITYDVRLRTTLGKVSIMNDGSIAGGFEIGQGLWTKVKQMTAFALGQLCDDLDKVHVILIQADTLSMIHQGEGWYPTMEILDCPGKHGECEADGAYVLDP
uniref:Aldehyde oxidase/xanthine dehydrogenase second molybdopterin binding domain-containing protein n=2 Tax=Oryza sativa subsp. japonica TaxID=39947 RepID=Q7Y1I4_ORYSJ|nr:unknown protein [Oryza sativa Japonica Group]